MAVNAARDLPKAVAAAAIVALAFLPMAKMPAFYESFIYLIFFWVSLSTSWALLSGFAGYFSLGHAAFFGVGVYTTAALTTKFGVPFLVTVPVAAALAALLAAGIGAVVFRLRRLRGELFALLTLAVTFVIATIILNTPIDGGGGVFMSAVPLPDLMPTQTGTIYILGFAMCVLTLATAWWVAHARLGLGLFAIHDDEDVAEAKGVPTFRYKIAAFALSAAIAGAVGGIHAMYVGFITVAGTFELTVRSLCRADERAGRRAPLAGAGDRRHRHHRLALRLHQRRRGDHGSRHRRPDPDRRHPVAARWRHSRHPGLAEAPPCRACDDKSGSGPGRSGGRTARSASARSCR